MLQRLSVGLAAAACMAAPHAYAASTSVTIRGHMPVRCEAHLHADPRQSDEGLQIEGLVALNCNADHQVSLVYDSESASARDARLTATYAGRSPIWRDAGRMTFSPDTYARAVRPISVKYEGGAADDRVRFARSIVIEVTPR